MRIRPLVCLPAAAVALIGLAGPAQASAMAFHEHDSLSVVGDVFVCSPTNLTVTSGTIDEHFAGVQDANGVFHFTGKGHDAAASAITKNALVNWGIAAVIYLVIGRVLGRLVAGRS